MNRRKFLSALSSTATLAVPAAAIVTTWPHFLRQAFAAPTAPSPAPHAEDADDGLAVVSESFRRAQRAGKPLLVFIVPADNGAKWQRGRTFGAWLNHGTAEQLWPLALAEVACATMSDLRRLVPTAGAGEPLMVLIETASVPGTALPLNPDVEAPARRSARPTSAEGWREMEQREDAMVDRQIELVARLVRKALVEGENTLSRRAAQTRAALPPALLAQLPGGTPAPALIAQPALVDQVAAVWAAATVSSGPAQASRVTALAAAVRARILNQRVPGSHWATSSGCGTQVEGHPDIGRGIACGMGHVPTKSARFLYFYTVPKEPKKPDGIIL